MENNKVPKLEAGMLVEIRDGRKCILIPVNERLGMYDKSFHAISEPTFFNEEIYEACYDIIRVWGISKNWSLFEEEFRELVWENNSYKEMTLEQIEKELGYKIKIINN